MLNTDAEYATNYAIYAFGECAIFLHQDPA